MSASKLEIGTPIDSWCTGCKSDQPHVAATLKTDGTLNKVRCNACSAEHVYRRPKSAPPDEKKGGPSSGIKRRKKAEGAVSPLEAAHAKPYVMDGAFNSGDVLAHAKFGLGRVTAIKPGGKMEVAFLDSTRVLVCRDQGLLTAKRASRAIVKPIEVEVAVVADDEAAEDLPVSTEEVAADEDE